MTSFRGWRRASTYTRRVLSLIPISDANPTRRFPIVTIALIVLNVFFFFQEPGFGTTYESTVYFYEEAPVSCQLEDVCPAAVDIGPGGRIPIPDRDLASFLTAILLSIFLHAGFMHIIGNMLFLWVFGNNVEDFLGPVKYLAFYLLGGIAASFAHVLTHSNDPTPSVGASGAVAAVMGAYILLYPKAKVRVLVPLIFIFTVMQLSAILVLGFWFLYQFFLGLPEFADKIGIGAPGSTGIAWMAHVGGFVFGLVAVYLLGGRPHRPPQLDPFSTWR